MQATEEARVDPRAWHYGEFYGLRELADDAPVALVHGNCQAESLRIMLDGGGLTTIRMPPVHELVAADLPHLERWLRRAGLLVTQPVRDDFGALPLGTAQLAARLGAGVPVVRVPVIRFAGLYPTHAIIRPPGAPGLVPPLVEYHDLRTLVEAAARAAASRVPEARLDAATVRLVAARSLAELRKREAAHGTVAVSDLFETPAFAQMRTLNHPGNVVWREVAARVRERLGLPEHEVDPGRELLDAIHAPRLPAVVEAFGLTDAPRGHWLVASRALAVEEVREAHLRWYAEHPGAVTAGLRRHADALALLGLA